MKSYPSSELRNVCDEQNAAVEPAEEGEDLLQQMLERRWDRHTGMLVTSYLFSSHTETTKHQSLLKYRVH